MSQPVTIPEDILERIRTLCLALPEAGVRVDASRTSERSAAYSFEIRRRSFSLLVARQVVLTDDTDWAEVRELVTESYRILAPKKLSALLD